MTRHFDYFPSASESEGSSAPVVRRLLKPGNRTFLEVASMVVTWWIVAFLCYVTLCSFPVILQCLHISAQEFASHHHNSFHLDTEAMFLYSCLDSPSCRVNAILMGQTTWAVWVAIKKYRGHCHIHCHAQSPSSG